MESRQLGSLISEIPRADHRHQLIKTQIKLIQSHIKRVIALTLTLTLKTLKILTFVVEHTMKLKNYIKKFHVRVRI